MPVSDSDATEFRAAVEVGRQEAALHEHPLEARISARMQELREHPQNQYKWLILVMSALAGGMIGKRVFQGR